MFYAVDDSCNITLRTLPFTGRCDSLIVHDIVHVGMILLLNFLNFFFFLSILFPFLMQLAVDLEVLRVIARTRMEIQAIRSKYTAMKAEREYLPPGILVDTLH